MTAIRLLLVSVALLIAALWWRWEKNPLQWSPPAAIVPDTAAFEVKNLRSDAVSQGNTSYISILDRPIFSPDRRPPVAIDEKVQAAEVDVFSNLQLLGLLKSVEYTGVIIRENGKLKRVRVSESLGGWELQSIVDRDAIFVRNSDSRTIKLVPAKFGAANTQAAEPGRTLDPQPQASINTPIVSTEDLVAQENQKREEAKRENIRKRNVIRAAAGLPPVFD